MNQQIVARAALVTGGGSGVGFALAQQLAATGRHVLIIEDIIDSGLTLSWLIANISSRGPASVEVCTLLRKPEAAKVEVPVRYVGFDIPNEFVVGYGLDYADRYRNLRVVGTLAPQVYGS